MTGGNTYIALNANLKWISCVVTHARLCAYQKRSVHAYSKTEFLPIMQGWGEAREIQFIYESKRNNHCIHHSTKQTDDRMPKKMMMTIRAIPPLNQS